MRIVMATKNEQDTIYKLLDQLREYDVIVVDDSTDSTRKILKKFDNVTVLYGYDRGIAHAYLTGLGYALMWDEPVLQMDAGLSHRPEDIPKFFQVARTLPETELILGTRRFFPGIMSHRAIISTLAAKLLNVGIPDVTCGFRLWEPKLLSRVIPEVGCKGNAFQMEMLWLALRDGANIAQAYIPYILGSSHLKPWMLAEALYFTLKTRLT